VKILINAFPLLAPKSGVGYYTWHLLRALAARYQPQDDFVYFYGRRFARVIAPRPPQLDVQARRVLRRLLADPYRLTQPIKELIFRYGATRVAPTLYHETNYVLLPFRGPQVVTVFDLSIKRYPQTHPRGRVRFFNAYFDRRLPNADRILAISEFTKRELCTLMNVPPERVTVTPLAPPAGFTRASAEAIQTFRQRRNLPPAFFLYLGNLEPRKNLVMLVRAYARLRRRHGAALPPLVLAGEATWLSDNLFSTIASERLAEHIILPGYVPEEELPLWYSAATLFVYPSLYEGFGLPVIEAMAVGTPVIIADAASLPEIAGDAAVVLPPDDEEQWAAAIERLWQSPAECERWRAAGLRRAAQFTWDACAVQTHRVYEEVVG
jgi:alpha-1,3-rhamnosyl/mannosyltransferase